MTDEQALEIAKTLGSIDARLMNIEKTNEKQWDKFEKLEGRVRGVEVKNAGVSATISGIVAVGIMAIKHSFTGQST